MPAGIKSKQMDEHIAVCLYSNILFHCSWDEWVPENRVLKYNETNIQKQKDLAKQHASIAAKNKKTANAKPKKDGSTGKDSDSRASTPSKELIKDDKNSSGMSNSTAPSTTTSRSRSLKQSSTASNVSMNEQHTRELSRSASSDEIPKYVRSSKQNQFACH